MSLSIKQIKTARGKIFYGLLNQVSTIAPSCITQKSDIGNLPSWSYDSAGYYKIDLNYLGYAQNKVSCYSYLTWSITSSTISNYSL